MKRMQEQIQVVSRVKMVSKSKGCILNIIKQLAQFTLDKFCEFKIMHANLFYIALQLVYFSKPYYGPPSTGS